MRRLVLFCLAPVVATVASCLGPTEIMLHVTTNACTALTRVDIYVGNQSAPATSAPGCVDSLTGEVGDLAIVPSGAIDEHIDIGVVGAVGDSCSSLDTKEAQCIVAKRALSFAPHTRLDMPVFLDQACAGLCNDPGTTCVPDPTPHCEGTTCGADGGVSCVADAGGPPVDAGPIVDVGLPETTPPPSCANVFDGGTPIMSWSFDPRSDNLLHEDHDAVTPQVFAVGNVYNTAAPTFCGAYLQPKVAQPLVVSDSKLGTLTFTLALAYRTVADGTILALGSGTVPGGYAIKMSVGSLSVFFTTSGAFNVYQETAKTNDGQWHRFVMNLATGFGDGGVSTTKASFSRDGAPATIKTVTYLLSKGPLVAGPIDAVDQVELFSQ